MLTNIDKIDIVNLLNSKGVENSKVADMSNNFLQKKRNVFFCLYALKMPWDTQQNRVLGLRVVIYRIDIV